jgi:hypothetical protein
MMASRYLDGPAVVLDGRACAQLDSVLLRALVDAQVRNASVPASLRDVAADIHAVALQFRSSALIDPRSATSEPCVDTETAAWSREQRLSTAQAARIVGVSDSYMRRVIARRNGLGTRVRGGGWEVDATALALWAAERQQQREGRADGQVTGRRAVLRTH